MEDNLLHNILELQERLILVQKKLDVAMQGLKVIWKTIFYIIY